MARHSLVLPKQIQNILDHSFQFQRYFDLLHLLQNKKNQEEKEIASLKQQLNAISQKQGQKLKQKCEQYSRKIIKKYRTVYALSKEKVEICKQIELYIHLLTKEFTKYKQQNEKKHSINRYHSHADQQTIQITLPQKQSFLLKSERKSQKLSRKLPQKLKHDPKQQHQQQGYQSDQTTLSLQKPMPNNASKSSNQFPQI